ncbi:hypothetical protein AB0D80_27435 [Streptomyces tendae]|uniref:hypothetical protein n=1 Tax=Streptomyces tendae TaxID=1932 RepID=UPI0033CEE8D7
MFTGQSMVDDLVEFAGRWRPDLVIWDALALAFAGPVVALSCGAAHARLLFGMDYISRMYGFYTELLRRQPLAEPSFLAAAREVREDQLAVPSPSQAVPQLERRAAGHRSVPRGAHSSSAASRRSAFRR